MKKIVLTSLFILASFTFAATAPVSTSDIEKNAAALDNTIQQIEAQTQVKYQQEQDKANQAADNVANYSTLLESVQEKIDTVSGEKKVSFYEKEYEGVLSSLNSLKKDLTNSINANQKIVNAFEEFSAIVNNN